MLLTQNQKLKFAVRSPNVGHIKSGVWAAWIKNDDLYIVEKSSSGILKVSLHASGVCNYSLTREFMSHEPPKGSPTRKIISWTRGDFAGVDHAKTLEIHFILIAGGIEKPATTADLTLIPDAPTGFATEVAVFYSETNPLEWESRFWPKTNIMAVWNLSSGAFACFRRRVIPLPDSEFQRILDIATGLPLLGIGEENPEVTKEFRRWVTGFPLETVDWFELSLDIRSVIEGVTRSFRQAVTSAQSGPYRPWTRTTTKWAG